MPIEPLEETDAWKAARTRAQREIAAIAWVRRGQAVTGREHLAVLDKGANLILTDSSGTAASVWVGALPSGIDVVLHHSHPDEVSLSGADLVVAWGQTPRSQARAYTPEGSAFRGRSLTTPTLWLRKRQRAIEAVGSELRILGRRRQARLTDATSHLVNAELAAAGAAWYRFILSASACAVLDSIADDRTALRVLIRNILRGE